MTQSKTKPTFAANSITLFYTDKKMSEYGGYNGDNGGDDSGYGSYGGGDGGGDSQQQGGGFNSSSQGSGSGTPSKVRSVYCVLFFCF